MNAIHDKYGRDVKLPGLVTILADKNIDEMLALLKQNISPLLLFQIDNQRTLQSNQVVDKIYACFSEAWQEAKRTFLPSAKLPWVICGSIYGIGEVFQFLNIKIQKQ